MFGLSFTFIARSHNRVNKRGATIRVARGVKIFEFQIWERLKGRHLQTKSPNTLKFTSTTLCNLNKSYTRTQLNHKSKQHNKQVNNARCKTLIARKESQNQNNFDSNRRTSKPTKFQKNYKSRKTTTTKDLQKHKNLESNKELAFDLQIGMLHSAYVYHMQRIKHRYKPKIKNDEKKHVYYIALTSTIKLPSYSFQSWDLVSFANPSP
jgi:hypothetical protein